jgi:hypothetical protein
MFYQLKITFQLNLVFVFSVEFEFWIECPVYNTLKIEEYYYLYREWSGNTRWEPPTSLKKNKVMFECCKSKHYVFSETFHLFLAAISDLYLTMSVGWSGCLSVTTSFKKFEILYNDYISLNYVSSLLQQPLWHNILIFSKIFREVNLIENLLDKFCLA